MYYIWLSLFRVHQTSPWTTTSFYGLGGTFRIQDIIYKIFFWQEVAKNNLILTSRVLLLAEKVTAFYNYELFGVGYNCPWRTICSLFYFIFCNNLRTISRIEIWNSEDLLSTCIVAFFLSLPSASSCIFVSLKRRESRGL